MKIPNLIGKDRQTILKAVRDIGNASKTTDKEALDKGKFLKYIVEVYDKNSGILNEVRTFYTDSYIFTNEFIFQNKIDPWNKVRGPFPLKEGALADGKLNRWEYEKKKLETDTIKMQNHIKEAIEKKFKYGYTLYDNIFGIKTIVEIKFVDKSLSEKEIQEMKKNFGVGSSGFIVRTTLSNGVEKEYP